MPRLTPTKVLLFLLCSLLDPTLASEYSHPPVALTKGHCTGTLVRPKGRETVGSWLRNKQENSAQTSPQIPYVHRRRKQCTNQSSNIIYTEKKTMHKPVLKYYTYTEENNAQTGPQILYIHRRRKLHKPVLKYHIRRRHMSINLFSFKKHFQRGGGRRQDFSLCTNH